VSKGAPIRPTTPLQLHQFESGCSGSVFSITNPGWVSAMFALGISLVLLPRQSRAEWRPALQVSRNPVDLTASQWATSFLSSALPQSLTQAYWTMPGFPQWKPLSQLGPRMWNQRYKSAAAFRCEQVARMSPCFARRLAPERSLPQDGQSTAHLLRRRRRSRALTND